MLLYISLIQTIDFMWPAVLHSFTNEILINSNSINILLSILNLGSIYQFKTLSDIVSYDIPGNKFRFGIVFVVLSSLFNVRLHVTSMVSEKTPKLFSTTNIFSGSGWLEREVWDFFGLQFLGNLDLRRILTDYGFFGFPLRKDFPLMGFFDVGFSDLVHQIIKNFLALNQIFNNKQNTWQLT